MKPSTGPSRLDEVLSLAARDHPERPALTGGGPAVTYAALDTAVTELAAELSAAGVRPGDRVGVYLRKSPEAVSLIYALLRTGAVAAPLDVADPPERTARMAQNAGLAFLVASPRTEAPAALVQERAAPGREPLQKLKGGFGLRALAGSDGPPRGPAEGGYLLFTSGSTGWPKGVLLSHANVLHFVRWAVEEFGVGPSDRIGSQASLTFDLSTFDVFGSALAGACLVLLPDALKGFPQDVVRWLTQERISIFYAVPTLYQQLLYRGRIDAAPPPELRVIAFAGEPFPVGALQRYVEAFAKADFYNLYGPTETNVCTFEKLPRTWSAQDGLSVGRPIPGVRVELVDDRYRVVGDSGELAVMGPTVFLGYLLRGGGLHDRRQPIVSDGGGTEAAYLTGDLGYYGEDGRIYLRGRRDHQIKRRGYRIDLQDIENTVQELEPVLSCAAVWRPEDGPAGSIGLYVVTDGADAEEVRAAASEALPRHMVPDHVRVVDGLPMTERGKIDREALASAEPTQEGDHG